ncbi:hypothetical protein A2926_01200 [Candidatus Giovannonibacteria bacterium RIFCSPLOWO2_01_FULL_44_40]|nr:MAG: hypothetical protein A2926_01200 [Candidatus Giovannonibacteria bacterium RIFCSPLOWO2_01_FULL_44_40]
MELNTANLLDHLADFAVSLKYENLPEEVVHRAKRRIFDSLGCLIMGVRHDEAVKLVRCGMSGKKWQTQHVSGLAIGMDGSYSLENAAFLNAHAIRALDWNDTYLSREPAHPSDNIGALLALAGICGGKELITALVLAYEIQCHFCDAASLRKEGWDHTYYLQLSSTLAAGKIIGLSKEQLVHAASHALLSPPSRQGRSGSKLSHTKGLYAGYAAKKGVESACLALMGMTGPAEIIDGEFGVIKQVFHGKCPNLSAFSALGSTFKISKNHTKLYPVEYHAQAVVALGLKIRKIIEDIWRIEKIDICSYEFAKRVIGDRFKRRPETKESADHSLFFVLASALLDGELTLKQYEPARLRDARIWNLIDKMSDIHELPKYNAAYKNTNLPEFPVSASVLTQDGWWFKEEIRLPKGHFAHPLSDEELKNKFGEQLPNLDFVWDLETMNARDLYWTLKGLKI